MQPQDFVVLRTYATVKHHIPGRLRLVFDPAIQKHPSFECLKESVKLLPGIKATRINTMAKSMVLEYDTRIIPFDLLQEIFSGESESTVLDAALRLISLDAQSCLQ